LRRPLARKSELSSAETATKSARNRRASSSHSAFARAPGQRCANPRRSRPARSKCGSRVNAPASTRRNWPNRSRSAAQRQASSRARVHQELRLDQAPLVMPRLRPWIGEQDIDAIERRIGQRAITSRASPWCRRMFCAPLSSIWRKHEATPLMNGSTPIKRVTRAARWPAPPNARRRRSRSPAPPPSRGGAGGGDHAPKSESSAPIPRPSPRRELASMHRSPPLPATAKCGSSVSIRPAWRGFKVRALIRPKVRKGRCSSMARPHSATLPPRELAAPPYICYLSPKSPGGTTCARS
jgi:hypothetical protein